MYDEISNTDVVDFW